MRTKFSGTDSGRGMEAKERMVAGSPREVCVHARMVGAIPLVRYE